MRHTRYALVLAGFTALAALSAPGASGVAGGVTFTAPVRSDDP